MGYKTFEAPAGNQRNRVFHLVFDEEQAKLDEVTIVGFGTQKKVSVTGSIASIPVKELERSASPSLSNALGGKLPGIVTRQPSAEPGADAAQVYIRGFGTWSDRAPLVLVDGVERDMNLINAQAIESVTILKDASATAVYGVKGANGVILIKTKRGKEGRPNVVFRTETAVLTPTRLPKYINSFEYASLMNEALKLGNLPPRWSEEELQKFNDGSDPYLYPDVDWTDAIMRKHTYQSINNLSVTGGNQVARYYTNVGFTDQSGIWKNDPDNNYSTNERMRRYNFRSNIDINVTRELVLSLGLGGIIRKANYGATGADALLNALRVTPPLSNPILNPDGSPGASSTQIGNNPWGLATQAGYSTHDLSSIQGTFSANWDLSNTVTKGLSLNGKFAYDYNSTSDVDRIKQFEVKRFVGKDEETGEDQYIVYREEQPLGYRIHGWSNRAIYSELQANYNRTFGVHGITGMVLFNQRDYVDLEAGSSIANLPYRRLGVAARATYSYNDKYLVELDMGYNGSENFPPGQRFGFFPSISAGWVLSNENFWKEGSLVNELKLRGSYGKVGNDQIGGERFLYLTTVNARTAQTYAFGSAQTNVKPGIDEMKIGTPNITWETATKANVGVDMEMLNGKISLQADAFHELRTGILLQRRTIPYEAGFNPSSIPYGNLGRVKNIGLDGNLEVKNSTSGGFYYSFRADFTYAHNTVLENDEPQPKYPYLSEIGHPIDQPWGLISQGFFSDQQEIDKSPEQTFQSGVIPGDIKYKDINGDNIINGYDIQPIGYPRTPEIMYGFGGTISYKGFDLSLFFNGAANTSLYLTGPSIWPFLKGQGSYNILREYYDNRWTEDNKENARYPVTAGDINTNNFRESTVYLKDAGYIRLKNVEIGYTLPGTVSDHIGMKTLRVFINSQNLYTWDKLHFINPESNDGIGGYPLMRTFNFGLQVDFK
ncbi:TonB-dependent receptor [Compostibacter hankyongensis]|uniref:TonB-dependent receptor n=2 Tax=Compostibacter hankyongensis TaxID=1007089 RepID=A0ABP8FRD5_9BACT